MQIKKIEINVNFGISTTLITFLRNKVWNKVCDSIRIFTQEEWWALSLLWEHLSCIRAVEVTLVSYIVSGHPCSFRYPFIFLCNSGIVRVLVIIPALLIIFCFSTFMHILKFDPPFLKGSSYITAPFHRLGNWGSVKASNEPHVAQQINGKTWTWAWLCLTPDPEQRPSSRVIGCCVTLVSSWQPILTEDLILKAEHYHPQGSLTEYFKHIATNTQEFLCSSSKDICF